MILKCILCVIIPRGNGDMLWWTDHNCRHAINLIFLGVVCENIWPAWKMIIGRWHHINMRVAYPANKIPQAIIYSLSLSRVCVSNGNDNGMTAGTMATLQLSMFQCRKRCNLIERAIPMSTTNHVIRYTAVLSSPDSSSSYSL